MTIKKLVCLSAIAFTGLYSSAQADPLYTGTITSADHGVILSLEGGYARMMGTPNAKMNGSTGSYDVGGFAWGANLGYAWALDAISALGLELGYANNGQNKYTGGGADDSGTLKIQSQDLQILGSFNTIWDSGINLFFKVGAAVVQQKANLSAPATINGTVVQAFSNTKYSPEPMAVIGMGYKITPSINFYVEGSGIWGSWNSNWSSVGTSSSDLNRSQAVLAAKAGLSYAFSE